MNRKGLLFLVLFASLATVTSNAFCNCPYSPVIDVADPIIDISADGNGTRIVNITGIAIDSRGYLVVAPFRVIVRNVQTDQYRYGTFENGEFNVPITVPTFASENQTLAINITSPNGDIQYGGTLLLLSNLATTSDYEVEIFIASPPPNYNWVWIIVFVFAFAGILAAYAIFTRWMIGKMVLRRADQIRLDEWKRKGGGQMQP